MGRRDLREIAPGWPDRIGRGHCRRRSEYRRSTRSDGHDIGPSDAETFWTAFLRKLARRGLRGVKLVVSDAHEGLKAAVTKVLAAIRQRCRVGPLKNQADADCPWRQHD